MKRLTLSAALVTFYLFAFAQAGMGLSAILGTSRPVGPLLLLAAGLLVWAETPTVRRSPDRS